MPVMTLAIFIPEQTKIIENNKQDNFIKRIYKKFIFFKLLVYEILRFFFVYILPEYARQV